MEAFIIVFDLTKESTFQSLKDQFQYLCLNNNKCLVVLIIGNKTDLAAERKVDRDTIERFATLVRCPYIECSALTGENVEEAFRMIVREMRKQETRIRRSTELT